MRFEGTLAGLAGCLLVGSAGAQGGMYSKNSPVLQLNSKNFHKLITKSNQVSIVEFYAPWCGHCQSLKPKYEKAAKSLKDLAQVAALDCDQEDNKPLCGSQGIKGFPTLKIVKPSKKPGSPIFEDYSGAREAKNIVEAVKAAIPNKVKRVTDKTIDSWLEADNSTAKALLFSDKAVTGAFIKVMANEFVGTLGFGQVRDKEKVTNEMFGVSSYPTLIILPGGSESTVVYDGAYSKGELKTFLSQYATPSDGFTVKDKVTEKVKSAVGKDKTSAKTSDKKSFASASSAHRESESSSAAASATEETLMDEGPPTESPDPKVASNSKPLKSPEMVKIGELLKKFQSQEELQTSCMSDKSHTCLLVLLPSSHVDPTPGQIVDMTKTPAGTTLENLSILAQKHKDRKSSLFPFYAVPSSNPFAETIRSTLKIGGSSELEIIAVNGRRTWYRHYTGTEYTQTVLEAWVDSIRFGDGAKNALPESLLIKSPEAETAKSDAPSKEDESGASGSEHDEL